MLVEKHHWFVTLHVTKSTRPSKKKAQIRGILFNVILVLSHDCDVRCDAPVI